MSTIRFQKLKERTASAFLNAGLELIMERGYDAVSVSDIAELADYGRSTFYLHFRDKEDLAWALLRMQIEALDAHIIGVAQHLPTPQRELYAWKTIFETVELQREFFLKMDGETSLRLRQMQKDHLLLVFERSLRSGFYLMHPDVPIELSSRFVVGAIIDLLQYWLVHPEQGTPDEMARHMFRLIYRQDPAQYEAALEVSIRLALTNPPHTSSNTAGAPDS
jgi:AcrR family transcriptional regulator